MNTPDAYSPCDWYFLEGAAIIQSRLKAKGGAHHFYVVDMRAEGLPEICPANLLEQTARRNTVLICCVLGVRRSTERFHTLRLFCPINQNIMDSEKRA